MPREDYYERQAEKLARYQDLATRHGHRAECLFDQAHKMSECIPFGQPILVGHHSEKRDRNFRAKIGRTYDRSTEERDKAKHYQEKAGRIIESRAISSDAPDAIDLLREKLAKMEKKRDMFKAINKIVLSKKKDYLQEKKIADLIALGLKEQTAKDLFEPDFAGRIGIPDYVLTNDGANIRRIKARIEQLEKDGNQETTEQTIGDVRIVDSAEDNRIMIFFPAIPNEETRKKLKSYGFRWSPSAGAWQGYRTNRTRYAVKVVLGIPQSPVPVGCEGGCLQ